MLESPEIVWKGHAKQPEREQELDLLAMLANESDDATLAFALVQPNDEDRQAAIRDLLKKITIPIH